MTDGREVVEDYGHTGLSLRAHPVSFLRDDLARRRIVPCAQAMGARDGRWLETAGLILVRQRPGSAKGVMFVTIEDESGIANIVVWTRTFEKYRRVLLSSAMLGVKGRVQREGEVVHVVAHHLTDLTALLQTVGHRGGAFPLPHGRGDEFHHGSPTPDPRTVPKVPRTRDIGDPYKHLDEMSDGRGEMRVRTRDFR
jgi:error-prone DNA polymerase